MATTRQKKAIEKVVENGGNISRAMVEVGYSPATAKTPQKLTQSKGFQELMEESGLNDDLLVKRHVELLNKRETTVITVGYDENKKAIYERLDLGPDTTAVTKGLDMAYKLKGSYAAEKSVNLNLTADAKDLANPKLTQVKERFEEELRKQLEQ